MFTTTQISVTTECKNLQINYVDNKDFYIFSGESGIYIQNSLQYIIFEDVMRHFKLFDSVLPVNKDISLQYMATQLYEGMTGEVVLHFLNNTITSLFLRDLAEEESFAAIDIDNQSIVTGSGTSMPSVILSKQTPITCSNQKLKRNSLLFLTDSLLQFTFDPKYERLIYPFSLTEFSAFYLIFEESGVDSITVTLDYIPDDVLPSKSVVIHKPRFLFGSGDGTWWAWNAVTSTWNQKSPSGTYFEFSEFLGVANTYTEYESITTANFVSKFGESTPENKIVILTNNYPQFPKIVDHANWIDEYDSDQYLYIINDSSKATFIVGSI